MSAAQEYHEPYIQAALEIAGEISRKGVLGKLTPAECLLDVLYVERNIHRFRQLPDEMLAHFYNATMRNISKQSTFSRTSGWAAQLSVIAAIMAEREAAKVSEVST